MKNQVFTFILLLIAAAAGWIVYVMTEHGSLFWLVEWFGSMAAAAIMGLICLINFIMSKRKKGKAGVSPWKLFAVIDILFIVLLAAWSVWDMATDTGFMAGIGGAIGLYYGVPLLAALLIVELLVYKTVHSGSGTDKKENKTDADGGSRPVDIVMLKKDDWRKDK